MIGVKWQIDVKFVPNEWKNDSHMSLFHLYLIYDKGIIWLVTLFCYIKRT